MAELARAGQQVCLHPAREIRGRAGPLPLAALIRARPVRARPRGEADLHGLAATLGGHALPFGFLTLVLRQQIPWQPRPCGIVTGLSTLTRLPWSPRGPRLRLGTLARGTPSRRE